MTKDVEYCREIKEVISAERHRVENELLGLSLEFVPSQSNFIFAKLPDELDADVICEKMMSKGVIIRSCSAWGYRDCVRITVGKSAENTEMVRVLGMFWKRKRLEAEIRFRTRPGRCRLLKDAERAKKVALAIETGQIFINQPSSAHPELPFGGIKNSGFGREMSDIGLFEFANEKIVVD